MYYVITRKPYVILMASMYYIITRKPYVIIMGGHAKCSLLMTRGRGGRKVEKPKNLLT